MQYLALGIRCLIGVVFLVSSVSKVAGRGRFREFVLSVDGMNILPAALVRPVAVCVVVTECAVWILLVAPAGAVAGLTVAAGLLAALAVAISGALRRGVAASCRCFGASAAPLGRLHVVRNWTLVALAVTGALASRADGPAHMAAVLVTVTAGLMLGCLVAVLDEIAGLFRPLDIQPVKNAAGTTRGLR
ncbi:MauE/DoxX family redox-associated membrane protein [Streptomyces sp. NPDC057539]|uniref:MauE/DoxX family redox-associated membrane protein n=1 Tax=Streptomyces sp. NPDC057539 TaxID=3346159 RepID=UPI0036A9D817